MFKKIKGFIVAAFSVPFGWRLWKMLLFAVNVVIPLLFLHRPEAQITIILFGVCLLIGLILFSLQGFTRLLGLMHFPWLVMIALFLEAFEQTSSRSFFGIWVRSVILVNGVTLAFDIFNIFRYICGERESTVGL